MAQLQRALIYLRPYWHIALGSFLSLVIVSTANLISPQILRIIIDRGITRNDTHTLIWACIALIAVAVIRGIFSFTQGFWAEKTSQSGAYDMRNDLFEKIQTLSFSYLDQAQTGQLMTRMTSDVEQVRVFIGNGAVQLVSAGVMLIGSIVILFAANWKLAIISLLTFPLMAVTIGIFVVRIRPLFGEVQAQLSSLNTVLQENLAGVRIVQSFAREPHERERYAKLNSALLQTNLQAVRALSNNFPVFFFWANLGTAAVIWFGGHLVISQQLTIGDLVAFTAYLALLIQPLFTLGFLGSQLSRSAVSAGRIFEVLDAHNEVTDRPGAITLPAVEGRVEFDGVTFRYVGDERPVLSHVSFVAGPGVTVALVGQTGSGKSTIINLIPRFYDVTSGRVLIDGHDVRDVTLESLRSNIGLVLQETTLFSGSIRDNIAYGRPDTPFEQIEAAARAAQAHGFITSFPEGYDTTIGERGVGLSGGQRQRIAIARALLLDPRILILDESTSAVDAETEYLIRKAIAQVLRGRTAFIIAHRVSTVRNADLILLLDGGTIAASGTHEDLLRDSPLYGEIIDSQFGRQTGGVKETPLTPPLAPTTTG
ncbi:MAG: ABC transporter ATP-binding protein/permease [Chloroflexi bacterium]|nr:ABC transporter ATP-binding protein/permease [Chloroflexota bacterium]